MSFRTTELGTTSMSPSLHICSSSRWPRTDTADLLPKRYRWNVLTSETGMEQLNHYKESLLELCSARSPLVQQIFANATSFIKKSATLATLVAEIEKLDWYSVDREDLGDLYEGLLEKSASEKKSGAGQYFTSRRLIESIVAV